MGLLPEKLDFTAERSFGALEMPGFSRKEIRHFYDWFDVYAFHGRRPAPGLLRSVVEAKLKRRPKLLSMVKRIGATPGLRGLRDASRWNAPELGYLKWVKRSDRRQHLPSWFVWRRAAPAS